MCDDVSQKPEVLCSKALISLRMKLRELLKSKVTAGEPAEGPFKGLTASCRFVLLMKICLEGRSGPSPLDVIVGHHEEHGTRVKRWKTHLLTFMFFSL